VAINQRYCPNLHVHQDSTISVFHFDSLFSIFTVSIVPSQAELIVSDLAKQIGSFQTSK